MYIIFFSLLLVLVLLFWKKKDKHNFQRRYCSIPEIFGFRDWWEIRFHYACQLHDQHYSGLTGVNHWQADRFLFFSIWDRGYKLLAVLTLTFFTMFWWIWWGKKYED